MYYNKILRVWVIDALDYFLISAIFGSLLAYYAKKYASEEAAMERLKNSIIKESLLLSAKPIKANSKKQKNDSKRSFKVALKLKGGQSEDNIISEEDLYQLALEIKTIVEKLAAFLKQQELSGFLRIFFKGGRLVLELILHQCGVDITYETFKEGVKTQVIVFTITAGGITGFMASWYSVGFTLVIPSVLAAILFTRSLMQQIANYADYVRFKSILERLLDDPELQARLRTYFTDGDARTEMPSSGQIKFKPLGSDANPESASSQDQDLDRQIKRKMLEDYGLIENPTDSQLEKIISDKLKGGSIELNASLVQQRLVAALSFPFTLVASDHPFWELFPSIPENHLRWIIIISFTRLTLNQVWFIVWILIILEEIEQLQKRCEEFSRMLKEQSLMTFISQPEISLSLPGLLNENYTTQVASIKTALILDLNSRLNDLNDPLLQFIRVSKLSNVSYPKKAVSTPKNNFLSSKKKFVASKITNVRTKVSNIRTNITNVQIKNEKAADFISNVLGYVSLLLGGLTASFKPEFQESERLKPLDDYQTGVRVERSIEYYEQINSPKRISSENENSETPMGIGIVLPGIGKSYIIQGKSAEEIYSPQSTESPQFEIETFIEYEQEIPSTNGSSSVSANGNNPIVTSDPIVIEPIIIEIETDSGSGPININK